MAKKRKNKKTIDRERRGRGPLMPQAGETIHDTRVMMHV
jgi:hypothetical protein